MKRLLLWLIRGYQRYISPALPHQCRFYPTCSAYAATAIQRFGLCRGGWLALRRILKCNPFHPGGVDLVPETLDRDKRPSSSSLVCPLRRRKREQRKTRK